MNLTTGTQDHLRFLQLFERLASVAERNGDAEFGRALRLCLDEVTNGSAPCPMRELFVMDYLEKGVLPKIESRPAEAAPLLAETPHHLTPEESLSFVLTALKQKALLREDVPFLEALAQCDRARRSEMFCPIYRLLHGEVPGGVGGDTGDRARVAV